MLVMFKKFLSQNLNTCLVTVLKYMKRKTKFVFVDTALLEKLKPEEVTYRCFAKFTVKHMCWRLQGRGLPVSFAKFFRKIFHANLSTVEQKWFHYTIKHSQGRFRKKLFIGSDENKQM